MRAVQRVPLALGEFVPDAKIGTGTLRDEVKMRKPLSGTASRYQTPPVTLSEASTSQLRRRCGYQMYKGSATYQPEGIW